MFLVIILLLLLPLILLFLLSKNEKSLLPPGPSGLPIIGNLHQLQNSAPHIHLWKLSRTHGPLMSLKLGRVQTLVVSSARMAKEVLKTHDLVFASRPAFAAVQKLSYGGFDLNFAPYGDYWREMRKICVVHLFNAKRVQTYRPIREDEVARMVRKVSKAAEERKTVNLNETLIALVSTVVCRVAFGKRYDDDGCERSRFHGLLNEAQALSTSFFYADYLPWLGWVDRLNGTSKRLDKACKELDDFYQEIIDDHLYPNREKSEHEDFIDVLMRLKDANLFTIDLTWDHIKGVLMNVFIAGTDTSAASTVWAMTALMKNPKSMKVAQQEIRSVVGEKGFVDEDDLPKLSYLKAVIKETMRLYPSVPLLAPHLSTDKCVVNGYEIAANTLVHINGWAIGRDPEHWENPTEFMPERFLGSSIDFRGNDFELIPFGAGRRSCPGIYMGIVAVEIALANLLYSFDWEVPDGVDKDDIDTEATPGTTVHKKIPLCLVPTSFEPISR